MLHIEAPTTYPGGVVHSSSRLRDRTATAILEAAALVFFEDPTAAMDEVADAAGVGRATLYRYFPSREALLRALAVHALDDTAARLGEAELAEVPVAEGVARAARALVAVWSTYAFLEHEAKQLAPAEVEERVGTPIRTLLRRGMADGTLRADWSEEEQSQIFGGLLHAAGRLTAQGGVGVERAAAMVSGVFLRGLAPSASGPERARPGDGR